MLKLSNKDMKHISKISIVGPLSSLSKRTRLYKLSTFLNTKFNCSIEHVGWERIKGERKETNLNFDITKKIILTGGGYGGRKIKWMYFFLDAETFF